MAPKRCLKKTSVKKSTKKMICSQLLINRPILEKMGIEPNPDFRKNKLVYYYPVVIQPFFLPYVGSVYPNVSNSLHEIDGIQAFMYFLSEINK